MPHQQMPVSRSLPAAASTNCNSQQWNFVQRAEESQLEQLAAQYRCIIYDRIRMDNGGARVYMKCEVADLIQCPFRMRYGPNESLYSRCEHNHPQTSPGMSMLPIATSHQQQQQQQQQPQPQPKTKIAKKQKKQEKKKEKAKKGIPGWRLLQTVKDENELRGMFAGREFHWHLIGKKRKWQILRFQCQQWTKCRYQLGWFMKRQELRERGQHNHPIEKNTGGEGGGRVGGGGGENTVNGKRKGNMGMEVVEDEEAEDKNKDISGGNIKKENDVIVIDDDSEEEEEEEKEEIRGGGEEDMNADADAGEEKEVNTEMMPCRLRALGGAAKPAADGQVEEGKTDGHEEEETLESSATINSTTTNKAAQKGANASSMVGAANGYAKRLVLKLVLNKSGNFVQHPLAHPSANQIHSKPPLGQCLNVNSGWQKGGGDQQSEQGQDQMQQVQSQPHQHQHQHQQQQNQQGTSTSASEVTNGGAVQQQTNLAAAMQANGGGPLGNNSPPPPPSRQELAAGGVPHGPQIQPPFLLADLVDQFRACAEWLGMQMEHQHNDGGSVISIWRMERNNVVAQCSTDTLIFEDKLAVIKVHEMRKFEEQKEMGRLVIVKQMIGLEEFWLKADARQFMMAVQGKCVQFLCEQYKWD